MHPRIRDMLHFCRETGAKGNVNFEGIGYEKLAAEDPEALAELRAAVSEGMVEPVGCSYGQPYGLFHGGESNLRQRVYGARAVRRLLGIWPQTFWEEEFDFFPQLPQMLATAGFRYASLFFQWTWHTPEIPKETEPVIWWEGHDGTRLLCATRNRLNLHQWPEDMELTFSTLAEEAVGDGSTPLILQWLELMPSPDWMCRSEVLLPKMRELLADERFEIRMGTLGEYLEGLSGMGVSPMVSLDVSSEVRKRQGAYLPHWTQEGATYAVTFRLADSLPREVREEYAREREQLRRMHEQGRLNSTALAYEYRRLYSEKVEDQLDRGHGSCVLKEAQNGDLVANALKHFDGERYELLAYCVMPNHVHVIVRPRVGFELKQIVHSWKSYTAHEINQSTGVEGALWQVEYYDHLVRNSQDLSAQIRYVLENPNRAGLSDWRWVWAGESFPDHDRDGHGNHGRDAHAALPVRRYSMDQVWHGMSLGKNNDNIRRLSREAEQSLLSAETMAAIGGLMGRPYAQWDVYPTWELEEAWREVLSAQHHDNDECEGLCGHIGRFSYERSLMISSRVGRRGLANLMRRFGEPLGGSVNWGPMKSFIGGLSPAKVDGTPGRALNGPTPEQTHLMLVNTLGWPVQRSVGPRAQKQIVEVPAFGYAFASWQTVKVDPEDLKPKPPVATRTRGDLEFEFDHPSQRILQLKSPEFPEGVFASEGISPVMTTHAGVEQPVPANRYDRDMNGNAVAVGSADKELRVHALFADHCQGVQLSYWGNITRPDPGMKAGYWVEFPLSFRPQILADQPYSINEVQGGGPFLKKYPEGDWMTSPQWFEEIDHSITALTLLDLVDADNPDRGLLIVHNGNQQWFVDHERQAVRCLITMYDPWDERYFRDDLDSKFLLLPHGPMTNSERWKTAQEWLRPSETSAFASAPLEPQPFSALSCDAPNVVMTAFYRETEDYSGKYLENYAGEGMGYPYVVRLVEFDGLETVANLTVSGTVGKAFKTNALGVIEEELSTDGSIGVPMRPYEIATVYLDIVEGRKQTRDLDAKREIWATVHRVED